MATKKSAPVAEVQESDAIEIGSSVRFLGYGADTPEAERTLEEGGVYPIVGLPGVEQDEDGNEIEVGYTIRLENPDFNPKKKANEDTNPQYIELEVFEEEIELVDDEEVEEVDEEVDEAEEEVEEAPAPKATKGKAAAPAKATATKGKATAAEKDAKGAKATKPAKAAAPAKAAPAPQEEEELPELENEDAEVLALIEGSEDLIALAQDLESQVAASEYRLGGVLYHIHRDKAYLSTEGGEQYDVPGGFKKFLLDFFNVDYRKAMYLIEIYIAFTQIGIEDPSSVVASIGWTKASKLTKAMADVDADGAAELIELAEQNSVADLSEIIKEKFTVGGTGGEKGVKKSSTTLKFRFTEERAQIVESVLDVAGEQLACSGEDALFQILSEWAVTNNVETQAAAAAKPAAKVAPKAAAKTAPKATAAPAKPAAKAAAKPAPKATAKARR